MYVARFVSGMVAGFVATLPMTLAMELMHRFLPPTNRYPLPPRHITEKVTRTLGVRHKMNKSETTLATLALHFGFGTAGGSIYALVAPRIPLPTLLKGWIFGLCVWAGSYLGWLPALGMMQPATKHPGPRNLLMIVAHLVWGTVLSLLVDAFYKFLHPEDTTEVSGERVIEQLENK